MVSFGGASITSNLFATMSGGRYVKTRFAENVAKFCDKYGFDGVDLDWEYPCHEYGRLSVHRRGVDNILFTLLLRELKEKLGRKILSIAVAASPTMAAESYEIAEISKIVDFVNLMTYDMQRKEIVEHHAPLFTTDDQLSISDCVDYWVREGCPRNKIILGIPTYGRSYTSSDNGTGSVKHGEAGKYTKNAGTLGFNEICEKKWDSYSFNEKNCTQYAVDGNQWVGYDSVDSVTKKCEYIKKEELGGAMFWSLETDDFRGTAGYGRFPLIKAALRTFFGKQ
ncbi:unnamed protein product [Diamesa hyperborea]